MVSVPSFVRSLQSEQVKTDKRVCFRRTTEWHCHIVKKIAFETMSNLRSSFLQRWNSAWLDVVPKSGDVLYNSKEPSNPFLVFFDPSVHQTRKMYLRDHHIRDTNFSLYYKFVPEGAIKIYKDYFLNPPPEAARFGAVRKHDIHTGVDLYCPVGTEVPVLESGEVIAIEDFTGEKAGSPWWHDTKAVLVEGPSGVILYGEVEPRVQVGFLAQVGDSIGQVAQVLKKDKGKPLAMLHLEWYLTGTRESTWWHLGQPQPQNLQNVEILLENFMTKNILLPQTVTLQPSEVKVVAAVLNKNGINLEEVVSKPGHTACVVYITKNGVYHQKVLELKQAYDL